MTGMPRRPRHQCEVQLHGPGRAIVGHRQGDRVVDRDHARNRRNDRRTHLRQVQQTWSRSAGDGGGAHADRIPREAMAPGALPEHPPRTWKDEAGLYPERFPAGVERPRQLADVGANSRARQVQEVAIDRHAYRIRSRLVRFFGHPAPLECCPRTRFALTCIMPQLRRRTARDRGIIWEVTV